MFHPHGECAHHSGDASPKIPERGSGASRRSVRRIRNNADTADAHRAAPARAHRSAAGQVQHTSVDRRHASAVDEPAVNVIAENGTVGARFCITENTRICPPRVCPPCSSRIGKKHPALRRVPSPFRRSLPFVTARHAVRISLILRPAPFGDPRSSPPHPRELRE